MSVDKERRNQRDRERRANPDCRAKHNREVAEWSKAKWRNDPEWRKKRQEYITAWFSAHPDYKRLHLRKWRKEHSEAVTAQLKKVSERRKLLGLKTTINGNYKLYIVQGKRPKTKSCELCGHNSRLHYHHWDNSNFARGLWLCPPCHQKVGQIEAGFISKYEYLKAAIERGDEVKANILAFDYGRSERESSRLRKEYARKHELTLSGHRKISGLNKRDYPGYCEICHRTGKMLYYHHWNAESLNMGMWICFLCHHSAEAVEKGIPSKYFGLKKEVECLQS